MSSIHVEIKENIAILSIDEPKTLNALHTSLIKELIFRFEEAEQNKDVRVIILTGTERSFVAGADIQAMSEMNSVEAKEFATLGAMAFRRIEASSKPVIAAINGFALGGGCELALACDIRIASDKAKFGQPEVGLGITPGFSGTQRLVRMVGFSKAKELIFTGKIIGAEEAEKFRLVNSVVPHDTLMEEAVSLAKTIAEKAPIAVSSSKKAINEGWDLSIDEGIELEIDLFAKCFDTEDQKEGMRAFLQKKKAIFKGR
ncbi:MAG: enoyl-CoA hydratase-related protein [Porphyromonas sp.]|nr:enoyl-CoA hydratase-related protein [Porphyromonas sp.]